MMRLLCITPFETVELSPGVPYRPPVPVYSIRNGSDEELQVVVNDKAHKAGPGWQLKTGGDSEITAFSGGHETASYAVRPSIGIIPMKIGLPYENFYYQYQKNTENPLQAVLDGKVNIYATPQPEMKDYSRILKEIEIAYPHLKEICAKPRSHLKSINEIRPIETVKRIGHESIPYLASHSEDWLARTASGLKPSRLYSRVEEDDYQIYENRVIKTIIDDAVIYLRRRRNEMVNLEEQLGQLIANTVNMESAGFDVSHQVCVSKILGRDPYDSFSSETKQKEMAAEQLARIKRLYRLYEELKKSRLYKSNFKSRRVTGSLLQTNILLMDKHYHQASLLWKPLREVLVKEDTEMREWVGDGHLAPVEAESAYALYCETMCRFALYSLGFCESDPGCFDREDEVRVSISNQDGCILLAVADYQARKLPVGGEVTSPIAAGESFGPFSFDGQDIIWRQKLELDEIQAFAHKHRHKNSTGAVRKNEAQSKQALYDKLVEMNKQDHKPASKVLLLPSFCELTDANALQYKKQTEKGLLDLCRKMDAGKGFALMPLYEKQQQGIMENAIYEDEKVGFLPVSMFDINSYRRIRNVLLRYITRIIEKHCPCCGKPTFDSGKGEECRNPECMKVYIRHHVKCERCSNKEYSYIWPDFSVKELQAIEDMDAESGHARFDSRFRYRNIVPMVVKDNKLLALCPWHH